jgi:uncharacterized protein (TIGR00106 family)
MPIVCSPVLRKIWKSPPVSVPLLRLPISAGSKRWVRKKWNLYSPASTHMPHNKAMRVIADFCLVPMGIGVSVSKEVAACERVLAEAGLKTKLHAYGTNIEGEWDDVFAAIKRCHEVVHAMGAPRISSSLRFGTRVDRAQTMDDKILSVERKLARE